MTIPEEVINILKALSKANNEAYLVGGCVRDLLMNRETKNWDITTSATPEQIMKLFADSFYDNKFGTVGIPIKNQESNIIVEVTTFRSEEGYSDRRHPDKVTWGKTLEEDLARRDFTINAIALHPVILVSEERAHPESDSGQSQNDDFIIIDPFRGQDDLKKKIIKAVGNPEERFNEDALRLMRAIRIAAELEFSIEEKTFTAIQKLAPTIHEIAKERISVELLKLLASSYPADGILLLKNSALLKEILPELAACFGIDQVSPGRHHIYDVGTHLVESLRNCPSEDPVVRLATLLHDIGKFKTFRKDPKSGLITFYNHEMESAKQANTIADRLRLSRKQKELLFTLIRWHQFTVDERQTDSAIRRFIRHVGKENIDAMLALRIGDRLGGGARETSWRLELFKKRIEEVQIQPFSVQDLQVDGNDVMKILDIKPGPKVGEVLNELFSKVEEGQLPNDREILLSKIENYK